VIVSSAASPSFRLAPSSRLAERRKLADARCTDWSCSPLGARLREAGDDRRCICHSVAQTERFEIPEPAASDPWIAARDVLKIAGHLVDSHRIDLQAADDATKANPDPVELRDEFRECAGCVLQIDPGDCRRAAALCLLTTLHQKSAASYGQSVAIRPLVLSHSIMVIKVGVKES